jgi:membrane peptidoglycan carboxypeptidase
MVQMATGAEVLASGGVLHEPTTILQVVQANKTIYQYNVADNSAQVLPSNVAYIMNEILSSNRNRQPEFGLNNGLTLPDRQAAVKTGTSDLTNPTGVEEKGVIEDNWTFGWTPQIVSATWVGNPDGTPLSRVSSGITGAAPLWQVYMEAVLKGQPALWYTKPADVVQIGTGESANYYLPNTVAYATRDVDCPGAYQSHWNGFC